MEQEQSSGSHEQKQQTQYPQAVLGAGGWVDPLTGRPTASYGSGYQQFVPAPTPNFYQYTYTVYPPNKKRGIGINYPVSFVPLVQGPNSVPSTSTPPANTTQDTIQPQNQTVPQNVQNTPVTTSTPPY